MTQASPTRRQPPSLARLIATALFLAIVLTGVVLFAVVERFSRATARQQAGDALTQIAWQMRDQLDRGMAQRYDEVVALAQTETIAASLPGPGLRPLVERMKRSFPYYAWIGVVSHDGTVLSANDGLLEGKQVGARDWFKGALHGPFVGDVHPAVLLAKLLPRQAEPWRFVDIAAPILDAQGQVARVLGVHLSWEWARELQTELITPALRSYGAEVFVVRRNGEVLLGTPQSEGKVLALPGFERLLATPQRDLLQTWGDGRRYATTMVASRGKGDYPGLGWVVVVRQPEDVAMAAFDALHRRLVIGLIITTALGMLIALYISRQLAGPLTELTEAIEARYRGVQHPIPKLPNYREAFQLSNALGAQTEQEARHAAELQQANADLERRVAQRTAEILDREQEMRAILEQTSEAFVRIDAQGRVIEWNRHATRTLGWTREEILGRLLSDHIIPPALRAKHQEGMARYLSFRQGTILDKRVEVPALHKDGHTLPVDLIVSAVHHEGSVTFNAFLHDISERKRAETALRESRERLQTVADNIPALVSQIGADLRYRFVNATYRDWFGVEPQQVIGQEMCGFIGQGAFERVRPHVEAVLAGQSVRFEASLTLNGQNRFVTVAYLPQTDAQGRVDSFFAVVFDITERKTMELQLQRDASHDALTGLPNRRELLVRLPQALARADRQGSPVGLLFLDLNGFKGVNDTLGHQAGDELLQQVAERLGMLMRKGDTVARLAGDEFVVLLEPLKGGAEDVASVAGKIDHALRQPFTLSAGPVAISASIGVSLYEPGSGVGAEALLQGADAEMYRVKHGTKAAAGLPLPQAEAPQEIG